MRNVLLLGIKYKNLKESQITFAHPNDGLNDIILFIYIVVVSFNKDQNKLVVAYLIPESDNEPKPALPIKINSSEINGQIVISLYTNVTTKMRTIFTINR